MKFLLKVFILVSILSQFSYGKNVYEKDKLKETDKLRLCIVEGKGSYHKARRYCPILEANTNIECIVGVDRLDCVRRIHKGYAHFGVFSSEDLVAARWAGVEVLVTNELRFNSEHFEYEMVAIVDNEADIHTPSDLRGSKFCHPGKGLENRWTEVIADYFESLLIPKGCESELSLAESKIKASAAFFGPSCKAGPWVPDENEDQILKKRYPTMCELCYDKYNCQIGDKHWGRHGPLYCLTSGSGQVAYVRKDDVMIHFGLTGLPAQAEIGGYSYLCPDGHLQPLTTNHPCVWVAKPWPVIAAKRTHAQKVQNLFDSIRRTENQDWQTSLLMLLESYHVNITTLDLTVPIDDYLDQADGFQSAYSFPSCNPPRTIVYCTTSIVQFVKCTWLQEASSVYGVEPNIQCIRGEHIYRCLDDVAQHTADVVLVDQDDRFKAEHEFNLTTLLHEYSSNFSENYAIVAVVKENSNIRTFMDLRGKSACFPSHEGAAYFAVLETLNNLNISSSKCSSEIKNFFSKESCLWNSDNCPVRYQKDEGALKCLTEGRDVAFMSLSTFHELTNSTDQKQRYRILCPYPISNSRRSYRDHCYLNWAHRGNIMVNRNITHIRRNEILNSLKSMDRIFGTKYQGHTIPFTLYGPFDNKRNILFRDTTESLKTRQDIKKYQRFERNLEEFYENYNRDLCITRNSASSATQSSIILHVISIIIGLLYSRN